MQTELEHKFFEEDNLQFEKLSSLSKIHRINVVEKILGGGDPHLGKLAIKQFFESLTKQNFLANEIGNMIGKDRHVIQSWLKGYNVKTIPYKGNKKSTIILTLDKKNHQIKHARYETIKNTVYRTFYVYPDKEFAYIIGLVLGDGHPDDCKTYIVGGKPYIFLDRIYPIIKEVMQKLGNRATKIIYYTKEDKELGRNDPNVSYWRIYIYWSAFTHLFEDKELLKDTLLKIWSRKDLFNSFSAGIFDTDGYFAIKNNVPTRIALDQTVKKLWFPLYCEELKNKYNVSLGKRIRNYKILNRGKIYVGISESNFIILKESSWGSFINDILKPYSNKQIYRERNDLFIEHALKNQNRWKL